MLVECYVHKQAFSKEACHEHHKTPRALGGVDSKDNLVYLCANCHTLIHRCAQLFLANKGGIANDLAMSSYPTPASRERFMELVGLIIKSSSEAEDLNLGRDKAVILINLSHQDHARLKTLAFEKKINGRKVGVSKYIEALIQKHLRDKGMSAF
jgi:hypothetical protein